MTAHLAPTAERSIPKLIMKHLPIRPWHLLALLLLGTPLAWAAVSITGMVITTVKQLSFSQASVEMNVGQQITQVATSPFSRGAVAYSSSDPTIATIDRSSGFVAALRAGIVTITADQAAAPPYPAARASYELLITGQPVVFQAWALAPVNVGQAPYPIIAPQSNSLGVLRYRSENPGVAEVSPEGQITVRSVGSAWIVAEQQAAGPFSAGSTRAELVVNATASTLTWATQSVRMGTSLTLQAPNSTNPSGAFSYEVADANIASVSGNVVTPMGVGTTRITARQAASGNHAAASLTVDLIVSAPAFTITGFDPIIRTYNATDPGGNVFDLPTLNKPFGSTGSFSFSSGNTSVATVLGQQVTVVGIGETTLTALLSADPLRHDAATATTVLRVLPAAPTMVFNPITKVVGDAPFVPAFTSNSSGSISFVLSNPQPADFASVATDGTITILKAGTATLVVTQTAAGHFAPASASALFSVNAQALTANTLALAPFEKLTTDAPFIPAWTGQNSTGVPITVTSSNPGVAQVGSDGQTITLTQVTGSSQITLSQPASSTHAAASVSALLTVRQQSATPASLTLTAMTRTYGDAAFTPLVATNSDGLVTFSSDNSSVAAVDTTGRIISIAGVGSANITASVASTSSFSGAQASARIDVAARDPALRVNDVYRLLTEGPFDLLVNTLSTATISVTSSDSSVATVGGILGRTITPHSPGKTTITVTQAADANHTASSVSATVTVSATKATLVWAVPPQITYSAASPTIALPAVVSNNRAGAFVYASSNPAVATIANNTLTLTGQAGTVTLTATQAAGDGYMETQISSTVRVDLTAPSNPGPSIPSLVVESPIERELSQGAFQIPVQTNSSGAISMSVLYGPLTLGSDGRTLTPGLPGSAAVKVQLAAFPPFAAAEQTVVINIMGGTPLISFPKMDVIYDSARMVIDIPTPNSSSSGAFTYSSLNPDVAEIVSGTQIKIKTVGVTTIRASQAAAFPYSAGVADATLTVLAQPNSLSFESESSISRTTGAPPFTLRATSNSPMDIAYHSTNTSVASIDSSGLVTVNGAGITTLVATQTTGWTNFAPGRAEVQLGVFAPEDTGLSLYNFSATLDKGTVLTPFTTRSSRPVVVSVENTGIAAVEPDGKTLLLKAIGSTGVIVKHLATPTQAEVSTRAVLTVLAAAPTIGGLQGAIDSTWSGAATTITLAPTSPSAGAFALSSSNTAVAQVNGLSVTLAGPGFATLTLTQAASAPWSEASVTIPVTVKPAPVLLDTLANITLSFGDPGVELPATLGGKAVTYTSGNNAVALIGGVSNRTVSPVGVGSTTLFALDGTNTSMGQATFTVMPGLPNLVLSNLVLPSTTFSTTLKATSTSQGTISYAVTGGNTAIVQLNAQGNLLVQGVGTVEITASQAADANHRAHSVTASVTVQGGNPGFVVTSAPAGPVKRGDTFEIRYRANTLGETEEIISITRASGVPQPSGHITMLSQTRRARVDEDGVFVLKVSDSAPLGREHWIGFYFQSMDPGMNMLQSIDLPLALNVEVAGKDQTYNLGAPYTLDFNIEIPLVMPQVRDGNGNVASLVDCNLVSSNTSVLRSSYANGERYPGWRTAGAGQATLSCSNNASIQAVVVTVLPADPQLRGFEKMDLSMDAPTQTIVAPTSLNATGTWTFSIENPADKTVAVIENGTVVAKASGSAVLRATQSAAGNYRQAHIDAVITVLPSVLTGFQDVTMTYGDSDFRMPLPTSSDTVTAFVLTSSDQNVATVSDGNLVSIKGAGTAIITARQGASTPVTATLTVRKAVPTLVLRVPAGLIFDLPSCYAIPSTWPVANQFGYPANAVNPIYGASLTTDSNGTLTYRTNSGVLKWPSAQPSNPDYALGQLEATRYTFATSIPQRGNIWVVQSESNNFLAATSAAFPFTFFDSSADEIGGVACPL